MRRQEACWLPKGIIPHFFFLILEGEIRLTRDYDRQTVLMGVLKPGQFTGEVTLLLDIPWLATARDQKAGQDFPD